MTLKFVKIVSLVFFVSCASLSPNGAKRIAKFKSDGCSMFPDGTFSNSTIWLSCCEAHDFYYWIGGTYEERECVDEELKRCVAAKGYPLTGKLMSWGTHIGGSASFSTTFRWGYGWSYKREYGPITKREKRMVEKVLTKEDRSRYSLPWEHNVCEKIDGVNSDQ